MRQIDLGILPFDAEQARQRLQSFQSEEGLTPRVEPFTFVRPRLTGKFTLVPYTAHELGIRMKCEGPALSVVLALCEQASRTPAAKGWVGFPSGGYAGNHTRRQLNVALRSLVRHRFLEVRSVRKRNGAPHGRRFRLLGWQRSIPPGAIGAVDKSWLSRVVACLPSRSQAQLLVALTFWFHWQQAGCAVQELSVVNLPKQCRRHTFYRALKKLKGAKLIEYLEPRRYTIGGIGLARRPRSAENPGAAGAMYGLPDRRV